MTDDGTDLRRPYPRTASGVIHSRNKGNQVFIRTSPILTLGMCGGPVIKKFSIESINENSITGTKSADTKSGGGGDTKSGGGGGVLTGTKSADTKSGGGGGVQPASRKKSRDGASTSDSGSNSSAGNSMSNTDGMMDMVCGVVEGIVPVDFQLEAMQGLGCIVDGAELQR